MTDVALLACWAAGPVVNQTVMSGRPADRRASAQLGLRARALAPRMRMAGTPGEAHHDSVVRGRSEAPGQRAFKQER
jgi:hypothetical protein